MRRFGMPIGTASAMPNPMAAGMAFGMTTDASIRHGE
jgi:hypothetical protein